MQSNKANDVLHRIEMSPLAVIRTGFLGSNMLFALFIHQFLTTHNLLSECLCWVNILVRVGLIETNSALLSSASLHPDVVDRLFELLLGQLVIAQDGTLRQISCQLLTTRLQIYASSEVLAHR